MADSCVPVAAAPLLGQDNQSIFGELLGYSSEQIDALRAAEVI
jgi:hypothetical protein